MSGVFRRSGVEGYSPSQPAPRRKGTLGLDNHPVLLAQLGNARPPPAPAAASTKTEVLMLYSPELKDSATAFARLHFELNDQSNVVPIKSFQELAATIKAKSPIGTLVLDFHGGTGGEIKVGYEGDEVGSSRVRKLFTNPCAAAQPPCTADALPGSRYCLKHRPAKGEIWFGPRIDKIVFESCVVGQAPDQLAAFGKLFRADSVTGGSWFHVVRKFSLPLPKASTEAAIVERLKPFQKYLIAGNPTPVELAAKCKAAAGKQEMWSEWWRSDDDAALPKSLGGPTPDNLCKPRSEVRQKTIASADAAAAAAEMKNSLLDPTAEEITVQISY
jgi:hypothetical protein